MINNRQTKTPPASSKWGRQVWLWLPRSQVLESEHISLKWKRERLLRIQFCSKHLGFILPCSSGWEAYSNSKWTVTQAGWGANVCFLDRSPWLAALFLRPTKQALQPWLTRHRTLRILTPVDLCVVAGCEMPLAVWHEASATILEGRF